jgi:hypothetical protein
MFVVGYGYMDILGTSVDVYMVIVFMDIDPQ